MTTRREVLAFGAAVATPGVGRLLAAVPRASRRLDILVLGGTGFFGPHQVEYALARGHHLTLFNRGHKDAAAIYGNRVEVLIGDRDVKTSLALPPLKARGAGMQSSTTQDTSPDTYAIRHNFSRVGSAAICSYRRSQSMRALKPSVWKPRRCARSRTLRTNS